MDQAKKKEWLEKEIEKLNKVRSIDGKIGDFITNGNYGFVCQWNDGTSCERVVKILDSDFVKLIHGIPMSVGTPRQDERNENEYLCVVSSAATKSKNLMEILPGTQIVYLDERPVYCIVMPKLQTLEEYTFEPNRRAEQVVGILTDCCDGLSILHKHPEQVFGNRTSGMKAIVHGDIKPDNIFVKTTENGQWYILGDYGQSEEIDRIRNTYNLVNDHNPYIAPGNKDETSDIWALGWVMWYWLNGKKHPNMEDVRQRVADSSNIVKGFNGEPELQKLFLHMTENDPQKRIRTANGLKSELQNAMEIRVKRLKEDVLEDRIATEKKVAGIAVGIWVATKVASLFLNAGKEAEEYHGNIKREIALSCGGTFKGTWKDGIPVEGTYISPSGKKKTGKWTFWEQGRILTTDKYSEIFTGLINQDKDQTNLYQGKVLIRFEDGTQLEGEMLDGEYINGTLHYTDGRDKNGKWERIQNGAIDGFQCVENDLLYGWMTVYSSENCCYMGAIWQGQPMNGTISTLNLRFSFSEEKVWKRAWCIFSGLFNFGGRFTGTWNQKGFPDTGMFIYSTGESLNGRFDFWEDQKTENGMYTGMVLNGKPCGYGMLNQSDENESAGEFKAGKKHGANKMTFLRTKTSFISKWNSGAVIEGDLVFQDGNVYQSNRWSIGATRLASGFLFDGIYCIDKENRLQGIGKVLFDPLEYIFEGEIYNDRIAAGVFYDQYGNIVSEDEVFRQLNK